MKLRGKLPFFGCATLLTPIPVQAHPFRLSGDSIGFFSGLVDPFASADHILAMLAVGAWVYTIGRPLVYFLPIVFVGLMLVSGYTVPVPLAVLIVSIFAFFHGYVHAFDMLLGIETVMYTTGFAIGALLLMSTGLAMRLLFVKVSDRDLNRFLGGGD